MIPVQSVISAVAARFGTTPDLLKGPRQRAAISQARQIGYLIAYELCPYASMTRIAREFGGRDHTTIIYGVEKAQKRIRENPELEKVVNEIQRELREGQVLRSVA